MSATRQWVVAARPIGRALLASDFQLETVETGEPGAET